MKVLVACEYSGMIREAFAARGHYALSCDFEPTEQPGNHYQGDVFDVIDAENWDMMIGNPPCTYLANSGCQWLYNKDGSRNEERWDNMAEGAEFFRRLWAAPIPRICLENSIMVGHAARLVQMRADQTVQPWQFGHPESKGTALYLKNLPQLRPTNVVYEEYKALPKNEGQRVHMLPPGPLRWKERSRTFRGIAEAMAEQWGDLAAPTMAIQERLELAL